MRRIADTSIICALLMSGCMADSAEQTERVEEAKADEQEGELGVVEQALPQSFSFQRSCVNWGTYPSGTHWARCRHGIRNRPSPQYSEMSAARWNACTGDISNCNGYLHCAATCP